MEDDEDLRGHPTWRHGRESERSSKFDSVELVGTSAAMQRLRDQIERVAPTDANVLIIGESGTGKETIAHLICRLSERRELPFVSVNCGAIPVTLIEAALLGHEKSSFTGAERRRVGYFESAHGGTLFLDEISEMPAGMQVMLLRVLEARRFQRVGGTDDIEVDVRVIAASNRDIERDAQRGRFREDLLYRLSVFPLWVPPLRARSEDITLLARHFLGELNARARTGKVLSRKCVRDLQLYRWPGNVRELKNVISRAFILCDQTLELSAEDLRETLPEPEPGEGCLTVHVGSRLADAQRALMIATLAACAGNKPRCATLLGVSLKTLYNRLGSARAEANAHARMRYPG